MPPFALLFLLVLTAASLLACERKEATTATIPAEVSPERARTHESQALAKAVDSYAQAQNPENDAAVRKAMADVDSELAELEELVAKRQGREREAVAGKLRHLEAYRSAQTTRFAEAQAATGLIKPEARPTGKDSPARTTSSTPRQAAD